MSTDKRPYVPTCDVLPDTDGPCDEAPVAVAFWYVHRIGPQHAYGAVTCEKHLAQLKLGIDPGDPHNLDASWPLILTETQPLGSATAAKAGS